MSCNAVVLSPCCCDPMAALRWSGNSVQPRGSTARWDLGSPPCPGVILLLRTQLLRGCQPLILLHSSKDQTTDLKYFCTGQAQANGSSTQLAWISCSPLKEL